MNLSLRAYAAHRKNRGLSGGSHASVQKAIKAGRITQEHDGKINPARADCEWAGNTINVSQETLTGGAQSATAIAPLATMSSKGAMIRTARDANRLEIERLELAAKRGVYVEASKVRAEFEQIVYVLRSEFEGIPARVKAQQPETSPDAITLIERMVRQAMNNFERYNPIA
ncbi:MAG: hypothetical protein ACKVOE_08825 [Rickettsiales bacterium]